MDKVSKLHMYRTILRLAQRFPSVKKKSIIAEIKTSYRTHRHLTDPVEINKNLALAEKGISQLSAYSSLNRSSSHWSVDLDKNPMPKRR